MCLMPLYPFLYYYYFFYFVLFLFFSSKRVTQFQFSVCMYGTCGRIDNKADFDFDYDDVL